MTYIICESGFLNNVWVDNRYNQEEKQKYVTFKTREDAEKSLEAWLSAEGNDYGFSKQDFEVRKNK